MVEKNKARNGMGIGKGQERLAVLKRMSGKVSLRRWRGEPCRYLGEECSRQREWHAQGPTWKGPPSTTGRPVWLLQREEEGELEETNQGGSGDT